MGPGEARRKILKGPPQDMAAKEDVITRTSDFIKWFLPKVEKMPRNFKFLFGDRMLQLQLDLLEDLIEAYYSREKVKPLTAANLRIEKLRRLLRISTEMQWISLPQFEFATRELNEIGGMTGGWIRHSKAAVHGPGQAG
jgi:hypothetical protein